MRMARSCRGSILAQHGHLPRTDLPAGGIGLVRGHCRSWSTLAPLLLAACIAVTAPAATLVRYGRPSADIDREASYPVDLLRLCLGKRGEDFELQPSREVIPQSRAIRLLRADREIDVLWTVTSPEREQQLLPVRIPIDRGLYGWRLLLIRDDDQARFDRVTSVPELALLLAGQGHDWPDLTILRSAGLKVDGGSSYDGLFAMLARGRIDYYPRALPEVWAELQQRRELPLRVEATLVLHYPSAMYFFVSRHNPALGQSLHDGMRRAIDDGSFAALFERYFGAAIAKAELGRRRILAIDNPLLPDLMTASEPAYWYAPMSER